MKILITGGTGFVGKRLVHQLLSLNHELVLLSRNAERAKRHLPSQVPCFDWDPMLGSPREDVIRGIDAVVNLMGEGIADKRWSQKQKMKIHDSRVIGTNHLLKGLEGLPNAPKIFVQASAIGFYPMNDNALLTEESLPGTGFLADVCRAWEKPLAESQMAARKVWLRIGVVLGEEGGALAKMLPLFKMGIGGKVGSGQQWMSWIHVDDLVAIIVRALQDDRYQGVYNAVAPKPVTNLELTKALGKALNRFTIFPAPAFALKLMLGEMSTIVLDSQRVVPQRLQELQHPFRYSDIAAALGEICSR